MPERARGRRRARHVSLICTLAATLAAGQAGAEALFPGQKIPVPQGFADPVAVADLDGDGIPDLVTTESVLLGHGDGSFQPALSLPASEGAGPALSVAGADLDGDGIPDLVVAHLGPRLPPCRLLSPECPSAGPGTVRILLGSGDGSFQPALSFGVEPDLRSVVLADLDGDGVPDLVSVHAGPLSLRRPVCLCEPPGTLSVRLGQGDGSFAAPLAFAVGDGPVSVAVADLDGDGIPDLVTANDSSPGVNLCSGCPGTLSVLLGQGDGHFGPAHTFEVGPRPRSLAIADVDADGVADLLTTHSRSISGPLDPALNEDVRVLLGHGDGTFAHASSFSAGTRVVVADLDDDGIPDLVTSNGGAFPELRGGAISFLGNGDGSFRPVSSFPAGSPAALSDLDGDGSPDLVTTHFFSNELSAFLGNGDGSFRASRSYATGVGPVAVAAADLDGDRVRDLVAAHRSFVDRPASFGVLLGSGDGTFQPALSFLAGLEPTGLVVSDLDGDRIPDLVASGVSSRGSVPLVQALLGNGDGTFRAPLPSPMDREPAAVAAADLDGDGVPDLATANFATDDVSVLLGNGDGSFRLPRSFATGSVPQSVVVADLDGDGIPDLVTANGGSFPQRMGSASVLLGLGDGSFGPANSFPVGNGAISVALADLDGDRVPDLVTANAESDDVSVLLGNGDGSFRAALSFPAGFGPASVAVADLDGDRVPDLVTANGGSFFLGGRTGDDLSVLLGNADGSFRDALSFVAGGRPVSVAVADLDGDRLPDLVTANFDSYDVTVLPNLREPSCAERRRPPRRGKGPRGRWERDRDDDDRRDRCRPLFRRRNLDPGERPEEAERERKRRRRAQRGAAERS